ncbi:MAG: hypothetical protein HOP29_11585 [Phycisphaerales bacterium]|nr:hypothetical protein [Phycisphaerales bacterium]
MNTKTLYLTSIPLEKAYFPKCVEWNSNEIGSLGQTMLVTYALSAAPAGKHDVAECPKHEAAWSEAVAPVLEMLRGDKAILMWLAGAMLPGELPDALSYVVDDNRYHIEGVTHLDYASYTGSWACFEFDVGRFTRMVNERAFSFEFVRISGIVLDPKYVPVLIEQPFFRIGTEWVAEHRALAFTHTRHFEGIHVFGPQDVFEEAISRVRRSFNLVPST